MKVFRDLSVTSAAPARQGGWTPSKLFASGLQGAWYDPSVPASLFQDAAGTVPVMADGDPVALIHDLSGNGNHAMQSVGAACPTWRTDGTLFWLEYDGVDDQLEIPAIAYGGPLTVCLGLQRYASGRWGAFRSPVTIPPYRYVGGSLSGASSTTVNTSGGFERVDGVPFVGSRDDLYEALLVPAVGVSLDNVDTALHAAGTFFAYGGLCPPGRVFGYLEVESMGASDINKAEHWMAGKIGEVIQ